MLRRVAVLVALVVFAASGVTAAIASSGGSTTRGAAGRAKKYAQAVDLRAGDLRGATELKAVFAPGAFQYKAISCGLTAMSLDHVLGGGESWLSATNRNVGSAVVVMTTVRDAEGELAKLASPDAHTCLTQALGHALTFERDHELETSHSVKTAFVSVPRFLGRHAVAVHVLAKWPPLEEEHRPARPVARYTHIDAAFFRVRRAEIALFTVGAPLPRATEAHLLKALHARAEARRP